MFCRKCGIKLNEGDLFCPDCGTKVQPLLQKEPASQPQAPQSGGFRGLIFEEEKKLPKPNEAEEAAPLLEQEAEETEETTEFADFDATVAYRPQSLGEEDKTVAYRPAADEAEESADESETEIAQPQEAQPSPEAEKPAAERTLPLFADDEPTVLLPQAESAPEAENATEMMQADETEEQTAVLNESENPTVLQDDTYNVYSGAISGVTSQDFSYRTDNGFSGMNSGFQQSDFSQNAPDYGYQPVPPQEDYSAYQPEQSQYPQPFIQPEELPKKKNAAMWVIIICISVIIIALGASCAVILTQYDSFGDFFASFGESVKENDEDEGGKEKEKTTKPEEPETEETTEQTTAALTEPTTAPRAYDGYCGVQVMFDYDEASKQLTVFGTGEMQNYENTSAPWAGSDVSVIVIEEGVTSVTAGAFAAVSPMSISVPASVVNFDVLALNMFGEINVSPSNSVYSSANGVLFDKTKSILLAYPNMSVSTGYAVPEGVTMIGKYAFYGATNLQTLFLSSTVTFIDEYAFKDCTGILSLEIPATVAEIRTGIFYGWQPTQKIRVVNPETKAVDDWNEGCGAYVTIG